MENQKNGFVQVLVKHYLTIPIVSKGVKINVFQKYVETPRGKLAVFQCEYEGSIDDFLEKWNEEKLKKYEDYFLYGHGCEERNNFVLWISKEPISLHPEKEEVLESKGETNEIS